MATLGSRLFRLALPLGVAFTLTAGLVSSAEPADAQEPGAIDRFDVASADDFPDDALNGERNASASDELLLTDVDSGLSFRRLSNASGTQLVADERGDAPPPVAGGRSRINPVAATGAGTITAPFAERGLQLSQIDGSPRTDEGPVLSLTSRTDVAEKGDGYTTLSAQLDTPENGKTYLLRTGRSLQLAGNGSPAALVDAARSSADPMPVGPVAEDQVELAQQWTVLGRGTSDAGNLRFLLANRENGSCLQPFDRFVGTGSGQVDTFRCDENNSSQLWEVRAAPVDKGTGASGLYNVGADAYAYYSEGVSTAQPLGSAGYAKPRSPVLSFDETDASWRWQEVQQPSPIPASYAFPAEDRSDFPFDLAIGDLDDVASPKGLPREEAVAVYGANGSMVMAVVDYSANDSGLLVTSTDLGVRIGSASSGGSYAPVAVDVADLDGDGRDEIVATFVDDTGAVTAVVARYTADGASRGLAIVGDPVPLGFSAPVDAYSADAALSDFDGDGVVEVAWVGADASNGNLPTLRTTGLTLSNSGVVVGRQTTAVLSTSQRPLDAGLGWNARVRVESGQFQTALPNTGARQVAVAWEDADGAKVDAYAVSSVDDAAQPIFPTPISTPQVVGSGGVSLAVGGFATAGGGDDMQWGIAISAVDGPAAGNAVTLIQPTEPGTAPSVNTLAVQPANGETIGRTGFELTAYDRLGKSLILGDPVVFTVEQLTKLNLVAGQPPAHSDWLDGGFVNISRNQDFGLQLGSSQTTAYDNSTSQESNQSYGLTAEANVSDTVTEGVPLLEKGEVSIELGGKLGASFESLGTALSGRNQSQTQSLTQLTQDDDIVNAVVQDFQVTRYPVLSVDSWNRADAATSGCEGGCYGYWDVVVPGTPNPVNGSGKSFSFFDPTWQNGNALSYPPLVDGQVPLPELGPVTYTAADGSTRTVSQALINQELGLGSVQTDQTLTFTDAQSAGNSETSDQGWTAGADLSGGVKGTVKVPLIASDTLEGKLAAGFNAGASFVESTTGSTANSHSSTFDIKVPAVDENRGYNFGAAYYYGSDGAPAVGYGVDLTANNQAKEWWLTEYGQTPDAALNLPYASQLTYDERNYLGLVEWSSLASRQELRGFTARMPFSDDPATSGAPYAAAPAVGDPVVFDVEVANFSLVELPKGVTVDFYAVPVDVNAIKVTGDPVSIGSQTLPKLAPQARATVSSPQWAAAGSASGQAQNWRVFAVVDQDNAIDEIHDWAGDGTDTCPASSVQDGDALTDPMTGQPETLTCGQNNQGFGNLSVMPADTPAQNVAGATAAVLHEAGVVTKDPATLRLNASSPVPQVRTGSATPVLVRADADTATAAHQTVVVYEGPPADGNVVAVTRLLGVRDNGTSVAAFRYTPENDGVHELNAVLLGSSKSGTGQGLTVRLNAVATPDSPADPANPTSPSKPDNPAPPAKPDSDDADSGPATTPTASVPVRSTTNSSPLAATGANRQFLMLLLMSSALLVGVGLAIRRFGLRRSALARRE